MIVTEKILSPHRSKSGHLQIEYGGLPELFTDTSEMFRQDWPNLCNRANPETLLEIVLVFAFAQHVPVLRPGREWLALAHQCGGYFCEQQYMIATRLRPRPSIYPSLRQIAREGWAAENGHFYRANLLASRIANYVGTLARIGVDCECTWRYLTESVYPIDATDDNLDRLAEDAPKLSDLAVNYQSARYDSNPVIFILTQNSD